ncbi:MAG: nucleoside kinase, partial [Oscillospiraceae bacterium]|nr:nucleoside kinase [Oscillospiraceae bacterium]
PSGSGKTTTAKKIQAKLEELGVHSHAVALDNYFQTVDPESAPRNRDGEIDYESPFCLDMDLLNRHFRLLDQGEKILIPKFEFARQMRSAVKTRPLQLGKDEIAIFEGIHALNDVITGKNPAAMKVYISARSNVLDEEGTVVFKNTWMRLARRTVRDSKFRAWEPDVTVKMWANVRRGEKLYISPFKDNATIMFDSSQPCEVSVMRAFAQPAFDHLHLSQNYERYQEVRQLAEAYPKFEILEEKYVAEDSLLREFIGGGIYDD